MPVHVISDRGRVRLEPIDPDVLDRVATALERIARALEQQTYGVTSEDIRATKALLHEDQHRENQ